MTKKVLKPKAPKPEVPYISKEVMDYLEHTFPEQSARMSWSDREVWVKAGERSAVLHLRTLFNSQSAMTVAGK